MGGSRLCGCVQAKLEEVGARLNGLRAPFPEVAVVAGRRQVKEAWTRTYAEQRKPTTATSIALRIAPESGEGEVENRAGHSRRWRMYE